MTQSHHKHRIETRYTHIGRDPKRFGNVVNTPAYRGSTVLFHSYAEYQAALEGRLGRPTYGRYGCEASEHFCNEIAELLGADGAVLTSSGNSAFTTILIGLLSSGDHLLMVDTAYQPIRDFCNNELSRLGIETTFYDPTIGEKIEALIQDNTRVIFTESPGSLTFQIQDIPAISKVAKAHDIVLVMDNTYGTPLLFRPFEMGVDVALASGSKYLSGHSDLLMGIICANKKYMPAIRRAHKSIGANPGVDELYLLQRGIRTLGVRMAVHEEAAIVVAQWLEQQPEVTKIFHPAFESCPGHKIWERDFHGSNGLFSFTTESLNDAQIAAFVDNLALFGMGYSWGGYESLILPLWVDKIRTATKAPEGQLFRIHIGLENTKDLIADLEQGFNQMRNITR